MCSSLAKAEIFSRNRTLSTFWAISQQAGLRKEPEFDRSKQSPQFSFRQFRQEELRNNNKRSKWNSDETIAKIPGIANATGCIPNAFCLLLENWVFICQTSFNHMGRTAADRQHIRETRFPVIQKSCHESWPIRLRRCYSGDKINHANLSKGTNASGCICVSVVLAAVLIFGTWCSSGSLQEAQGSLWKSPLGGVQLPLCVSSLVSALFPYTTLCGAEQLTAVPMGGHAEGSWNRRCQMDPSRTKKKTRKPSQRQSLNISLTRHCSHDLQQF